MQTTISITTQRNIHNNQHITPQSATHNTNTHTTKTHHTLTIKHIKCDTTTCKHAQHTQNETTQTQIAHNTNTTHIYTHHKTNTNNQAQHITKQTTLNNNTI